MHDGPSANPISRDAAPTDVNQPCRLDVTWLATENDRLRAELAAVHAENERLRSLADIDALTGVSNRRGFERELNRSIAYVRRYGNPAALIYLDLDRFKPINDTYGHECGDRLLQRIAAVLKRSVRASDAVARIGGDEFALLLWNLNAEQAQSKASSFEALIAATGLDLGDGPVHVGASAGVTMLAPNDDALAVIDRADRAMYATKNAKRSGA
jgi:diguanylate cyclase (GGDEF)-like protein